MSSTQSVARALVDRRRRCVLSLVQNETKTVTIDELAAAVAAVELNRPRSAVPPSERESLVQSLRHVHLPVLAEAGLIRYDDETATPRRSQTLQSDWVVGLLDQPFGLSVSEELLSALAVPRRRHVLTVLAGFDSRLSLTDLALHVAARERSAALVDVPEDVHRDVLVSLFHVHVPKLADVDMIDYDEERGDVALVDDPPLWPPWLDDAPLDESRDDQGRVWTLRGRDRVVAREHALIDRADDELILMIADDALLDPDTIVRLRNMTVRGVSVHVGSPDASLRDTISTRAPDADVWEPQLDWLARSTGGLDLLGRFLMSDREAVLLATLDDATDGAPTEAAITAEGPNNGVVLFVQTLLALGLDHVDATESPHSLPL